MHNGFTLRNFPHYGAMLIMCTFLSAHVQSQKSYVVGTINGIPASLTPNARILTADFDGDGDIDILYQDNNSSGQGIHYLKNTGGGNFTAFNATNGIFPVGTTPFGTIPFTFILDPNRSTTGQTFGQRIIDYDGDGDKDILEVGTGAGQSRILLLSGGTYSVGTLSPAFPATYNNSISRMVIADFDSDGDEDILYQSGNTSGAGIHLLRNDRSGVWTDFAASGSGTFSSGPLNGLTFTKIGNTADIVQFVFDADGDGDNDIYELQGGSARYFARSGGAWTNPALPTGLISSLGPTLFRMVPADFDKDGDIDFLFQSSNSTGANISYLRNNHDGTFTQSNAASGTFSGSAQPFGTATFNFISRAALNRETIMMDMDADGDVDIFQLGTVATTVLLQTGNNLPIKLESFTVTKRGSQVEVKWKTSEEINLDFFAVEYGLDAINFKTIYQTKGKGGLGTGSDYCYLHANPVKGIQYYRLVEHDLDGNLTYFPIKSIQFEEMKLPVEVYPNQVTDHVRAYLKPNIFNRVALIDHLGRELKTMRINADDREVNFSMSSFANGIYYLRFAGEQQVVTERIVKR